jgi:hypothetical protein
MTETPSHIQFEIWPFEIWDFKRAGYALFLCIENNFSSSIFSLSP